ncbi:hypothetical protein Tdes44962_MAKER06399 [Teratosphaeria destructans]|uniref:Uncharacterized protein n=1 Tax=Teratosphaeria destructans TaxID=418781 RepID=A0A9W7VXZ6_9PEZI|nr:hypothetical protein Tdes44962_MAKER06399 [Teratosphaeria destructans]
MKRKDSGYGSSSSAEQACDFAAPKTRDFALQERDANPTMHMNRSTRMAATAGVTIKAPTGGFEKDNGSVWRRMRITAFARLGGKA